MPRAFPDGPYLVVSPHYDDAVLSAFAVATHPDATVLTVCTAPPAQPTVTWWDRACGFADSHEAMGARRQEDDDALAAFPVRRVSCGMREVQYRGGVPLDEDREVLLGAVRAWLADHSGGVIVLPAGAGGRLGLLHRLRHKIALRRMGLPGGAPPSPEHVWVTDTVVGELAATRDATHVLLYDELPYAWARSGVERAAATAARLARGVEPLSVDVDIDAKSRAVACYASQLTELFAPWVRLERHLPRCEGYWFLPGPQRRAAAWEEALPQLKDCRPDVEDTCTVPAP